MTRLLALSALLSTAASLVAAQATREPCAQVRNLASNGNDIPAQVCDSLLLCDRPYSPALLDRLRLPKLRPLLPRRRHLRRRELQEALPVPLDPRPPQEARRRLCESRRRHHCPAGPDDQEDQQCRLPEPISVRGGAGPDRRQILRWPLRPARQYIRWCAGMAQRSH